MILSHHKPKTIQEYGSIVSSKQQPGQVLQPVAGSVTQSKLRDRTLTFEICLPVPGRHKHPQDMQTWTCVTKLHHTHVRLHVKEPLGPPQGQKQESMRPSVQSCLCGIAKLPRKKMLLLLRSTHSIPNYTTVKQQTTSKTQKTTECSSSTHQLVFALPRTLHQPQTTSTTSTRTSTPSSHLLRPSMQSHPV